MSANDSRPFGEVNPDSSTDSSADSPHFVSPNITDAAEEEQKAQAQAAAEQRQAETVNIDGVPIADQDIQYKTRDIVAKKADAKYFVNVKEEEDVAKAQAHQAKAAQHKTRWRRYGRPILVVTIVLILAAAGGFVARYFLDRQDEEAKAAVEELLYEAADCLEASNLDCANEYYEKALSRAATDEERSFVYLHYSQSLDGLMRDQESNRIYEYALKAYELNPNDRSIVWWLVDVYNNRGEEDKAKEFEEKLEALPVDEDEYGEG